MEQIEFKGIIYSQVEISSSENIISKEDIEQIKTILKNDGACLINSYEVSKKTNAKCIEGFVFCMVANGNQVDDKVIRHCWNIKNGVHFDLTNEFIWKELPGNPKEFKYYQVGEYIHNEYSERAVKDVINFLSDVINIAKEIDDAWQKELNKKNEL